MPYIKQDGRSGMEAGIGKLRPDNPGELNFVISRLCADYVARKGKNYATLNEVMGVLSCASQELYRRLITPYEEKKIQENGDISGYEA